MSEGAELLAEGRRRYEAGDTADAEPLARRVLELRPPGTSAAERSEALQLVAEVAYGQGRYAEAQAAAEEARALRATATEVDIAETDHLLGIIAVARGDPATGLPLLESARDRRIAALGPDDGDTIESMNNVGAALDRLGRTAEAIAINRETVARSERAFAEPHRQLAVSLNALAVKLDRSAETRAEAGQLYERALSAAEAALGPEHPMVATLTSNLATQRLNAGDVEAARPLVGRSLDLHERRHGPEHPNTATALFTAADLARKDGQPALARERLERALAIRLRTFGPTDIRTRSVIVRLLTVLAELQRSDPEAVADGMLILGVHRAVAPPSDPPTSGGPSAPAAPAAPPDPAVIDRLRGYLDRRARAVAPPDPVVRAAQDRAAAALVAADAAFSADDLDAARAALDVAIHSYQAIRGANDPVLVEPLRRRAAVSRADDRRADAIADDERALAILGEAYGAAHPYVIRARSRLAFDLEREYGAAAARPVLEELRDLLPAGSPGGVVAQLRTVIDRHLARIPADAVRDPIGRSTRRRRALEGGPPAPPSVVGAIGAIDWSRWTASPRAAREIRDDLRLLASDDELVVGEASLRLVDAINPQASLLPVAEAVLDPLIALATDPAIRYPAAALVLAIALVAEAVDQVGADGSGATHTASVHAVALRRAELRAILDQLADHPHPAVRLAVARGRHQLDEAGRVKEPRRWN